MLSLGTLMMMAAGGRAANLPPSGIDIFTWEDVTSPIFTNASSLSKMVFADGKILGASKRGGFLSYSTDDGNTWSPEFQPFSANGTPGVLAYGNGTWLYGTNSVISNIPKVSTDLVNWSNATAPTSSSGLYGGDYIAPYFYCGGTSGRISRSTDLITWDRQDNGASDHYCILQVDGVLLVGSTSGRIYRTTDFRNWTLSSLAKASAVNAIAYNQQLGRLVAVQALSGNYAYSDDLGLTWTSMVMPGAYTILSVVGVDGYFLASTFRGSANAGNGIYYSTDGVTWTVLPGFEMIGSNPYLFYDGTRIWVSEGYVSGVNSRLRRTMM